MVAPIGSEEREIKINFFLLTTFEIENKKKISLPSKKRRVGGIVPLSKDGLPFSPLENS